MAERRLEGRRASPGLAIGPLVRLPEATLGTAHARAEPEAEAERLRAAVATAAGELQALAAETTDLGAEVLEFQIEMLADPALLEVPLEAILAGEAAEVAWTAALDAQIDDFAAAEDEYFRARASDLTDLRDRVRHRLSGVEHAVDEIPTGAVLLATDLPPSRFLALDRMRLAGVALREGSPTSHTAVLARARGVPLATGLGPVPEGEGLAILDGEAGLLVLQPDTATLEAYRGRVRDAGILREAATALRDEPAFTADGQRVYVLLNIDHPAAVDDGTLLASDGVGLFRTEFLFIGQPRLPGEEEQYHAYRGMLDRLDGRPAVIRTLDVGGDKELPGVSLPQESNPFLGLRGIRLCLERPELFEPQLRALLRAAVDRPLRIMLPMITTMAELEETRRLLDRLHAGLLAESVPAALPPLGIMVETPAAAIAIDGFDAAFYSIGSNDLIQYVMAAARDSGGRVATLADPRHPAIARLIRGIVAHGQAQGREVSLCGDMGSDLDLIPDLLAMGLRRISVAPAALGQVKQAIRAWRPPPSS